MSWWEALVTSHWNAGLGLGYDKWDAMSVKFKGQFYTFHIWRSLILVDPGPCPAVAL